MAKYQLTDDESVAFVTALMGGLTYGPVPSEDGYMRELGWRRGEQSIDREIRALLAANVLAYPPGWAARDMNKMPRRLVRGSRAIDEGEE
jgi:hypothetical protein